jgi:hypothetical protein
MDRTIYVNFPVVYATINELRARLDTDVIANSESQLAQTQQMLSQVDGETNAELSIAMNMNKEKTVLCAQTLRKMLDFLENAARAVEEEDRHLSTQLGELQS